MNFLYNPLQIAEKSWCPFGPGSWFQHKSLASFGGPDGQMPTKNATSPLARSLLQGAFSLTQVPPDPKPGPLRVLDLIVCLRSCMISSKNEVCTDLCMVHSLKPWMGKWPRIRIPNSLGGAPFVDFACSMARQKGAPPPPPILRNTQIVGVFTPDVTLSGGELRSPIEASEDLDALIYGAPRLISDSGKKNYMLKHRRYAVELYKPVLI